MSSQYPHELLVQECSSYLARVNSMRPHFRNAHFGAFLISLLRSESPERGFAADVLFSAAFDLGLTWIDPLKVIEAAVQILPEEDHNFLIISITRYYAEALRRREYPPDFRKYFILPHFEKLFHTYFADQAGNLKFI